MYNVFSISQIRAKARETLAATPGSYLVAIIPSLLYIIMQIGVQIVASGYSDPATLSAIENNPNLAIQFLLRLYSFPILVSILTFFLLLSVLFSMFQVIRQKKESLSFKDAFAIFASPDFGKILATAVLKTVLLFVWQLLAFVGTVLAVTAALFAVGLSVLSQFDPTYSAADIPAEVYSIMGVLAIVGILLTIAGLALYIPQYYAYSLVELVLFDRLENGEYTSAYANISESRRLMKGYKMKRFVLDLTFIGWHFLVGLTFGIVGIYVYPYYYAAQVHFYDAVLEDRKAKESFMQVPYHA